MKRVGQMFAVDIITLGIEMPAFTFNCGKSLPPFMCCFRLIS